MGNYKPSDSRSFPRFAGIKTFMRLPHIRSTQGIDFAIIGVPWDGGATFRSSQRSAPDTIRKMSHLFRPYNPGLDVTIFNHCSGVDYGDLPVVPGYIEETYQRIDEALLPVVEAGIFPVLLGGDHSITLPELRAISKVHGQMALIHFDSHADINEDNFGLPYDHGTSFRRAVEEKLIAPGQSIQVGMRGSLYSRDHYKKSEKLGFKIMPMAEVRQIGIEQTIKHIINRIEGRKAFITFDIDVVDPAYAPGTGTPEIGGFTSAEAVRLIQGLAGINLVGCDVVEVLPQYDHADITALLAASIAYEFVSLFALNKKRQSVTTLNRKPLR